jgi:HSP20 family protein
MAEKRSETSPHEERRLTRQSPQSQVLGGPFQMMERFVDEVDRLFDDFGLGRGWPMHGPGRSSLRSPSSRAGSTEWNGWSPDIEVFYRNNELVVCADLPGLTKEDVKVDVTEEGITIQGERKREHEEEREGIYRSERSYGSFYRTVALPEGAMTDQAKATFKDGVLEIKMPAPPEQVRRGRRLEITEGSQPKK